jgi:hypothetical protein
VELELATLRRQVCELGLNGAVPVLAILSVLCNSVAVFAALLLYLLSAPAVALHVQGA